MNTDSIPVLSEDIKVHAWEQLEADGVEVSEADFEKSAARVERGVTWFSNRFRAWWVVLREKGDVIRVDQPANSPYNLVMARFSSYPTEHFPSDEAINYGFIPQILHHSDEWKVLNALWKEWLDELCANWPHKT